MYKRAILKIVSIICTIVSMVIATMTILLNAIPYFPISTEDSVAIIGGADGSTAIFLAGNHNIDTFNIGLLFAGIAGLIAIYLGKDK